MRFKADTNRYGGCNTSDSSTAPFPGFYIWIVEREPRSMSSPAPAANPRVCCNPVCPCVGLRGETSRMEGRAGERKRRLGVRERFENLSAASCRPERTDNLRHPRIDVLDFARNLWVLKRGILKGSTRCSHSLLNGGIDHVPQPCLDCPFIEWELALSCSLDTSEYNPTFTAVQSVHC